MPTVSLNTFIEFTACQGTARVVAATLPSGDYDPSKDFYKRLRERTVRQLLESWSERSSFAFPSSVREATPACRPRRLPGPAAPIKAARGARFALYSLQDS
jgi:hypothetical protein